MKQYYTEYMYLYSGYSAIAQHSIVYLLRTQPFKSFTGLYNLGNKYNSM